MCESPTWWRYVLISPLKEATLLLSWLPTGVEHATLVWTVLLHRSRHGCLVAVAHHLFQMSWCTRFLPSASFRCVSESHRWPRRLGSPRCWRWQPSILWRPLLTWLICPKKEVAAPGVALVKLPALIRAVFAHSQEECILTTVAHDRVTAGVYTHTAATWWRRRLWGPGGHRRERMARIRDSGSGRIRSGWPWRWRVRVISSSTPSSNSCTTTTSPWSEIFQVQHFSEDLVTATDAADKLQRHHGRKATPAELELQPEEGRTHRRQPQYAHLINELCCVAIHHLFNIQRE